MRKIWGTLFSSPFKGLPWLVLSYVIGSILILRDGGVFTGHLLGYDDQVRMTQVLTWINDSSGMMSGWYDRTLLRADPPDGFQTIWSRIVDVPIALVILTAQMFVPQKVAALIAAALVPLAELAFLFVIAGPYFARPLVGKKKSRLIVLFLLFSSIVNVKYFSVSGFLVGEASHHPYYIVFNLLMSGAVSRIVMGSFSVAPIGMLAASTALFTTIGIEGFPLTAAAVAILATSAWAFERPNIATRSMAAFMIGALASLLLLPLYQPPDHLFTVSFAEPSILGPLLLLCAGVFLRIEASVVTRLKGRKLVSASILIVTAATLGLALVAIFPQMLEGATAGLSPRERMMALHEHYEAMPVYRLAHNWEDLVSNLTPSIIALIAGVCSFRHSRGRRRALSFTYLAYTLICASMSELYSRYYHHAMTTACVWLLWAWEQIKKRLPPNRNYSLLVVSSFVALGPLWMLLLPAVTRDAPVVSQLLLFPATQQTVFDSCDSLSMADYIDDHFPVETNLVVPHWQSAQFLYQTDVKIDFLANYPSHDKFIDNYILFQTTDDREAFRIAQTHHLDLVTVCTYPMTYVSNIATNQQSLLARLQTGRPPAWLKRVDTLNIQTNFILYKVDKDALAQRRSYYEKYPNVPGP